MNKINAMIPMAIQINLDDVAWHEGEDKRHLGQASRSGIPRRHEVEDYQVLEAIGARLGMKILCPLVLGDWDKDNVLRGEVGVSHDPYGWDRASTINIPYAESCFAALENSEHIEYAIHGLNHGRYKPNGDNITEREYFPPIVVDGKNVGTAADVPDFKRRLALFDRIYESWGFKKKIRTFISPCGVGKAPLDGIKEMAEHLSERGIKYWTNSGFTFEGRIANYSNVLIMKEMAGRKGGKPMPWNAFDYDPALLGHIYPDKTEYSSNIFCGHWVNFLRYNPKRSIEGVDAWVGYFENEAETFGLMLSRDIGFSANQRLYSYWATLSEEKDAIVIDLNTVAEKSPAWRENVFYVSIEKGKTPKSCEGGEIELYETKNEFKTYKVTHTENTVIIHF